MGRINLRSSRLFLRVLPVLVWLSAVACVVGLFHHRTAQFELVGIADSEVHDVGTNIRARLISVSVQLFDKVNKGDPVAVVNTVPDDERLDAEIARIQAEIKALERVLGLVSEIDKAEEDAPTGGGSITANAKDRKLRDLQTQNIEDQQKRELKLVKDI